MGQIKVTKCEIEGLCVIEPAVHRDARGYFVETYNANDMKEAGLEAGFFHFLKADEYSFLRIWGGI